MRRESAPVTVPCGGEAEEAGAVGEVETGAGDEVQAGALGGLVPAHNPRERVAGRVRASAR